MNSTSEKLYHDHQQRIYRQTDKMFAVLMVIQWIGGIIAAIVISPRTWIGETSNIHIHVWAGIVLGGAITFFPVSLAVLQPGRLSTRYVIAIGQMMMSSLLIHLSGGRIETHFHVFGSLAFLAFYRDWRVLVPATIVVAIDHMLRGIYYPQSVFGVLAPDDWRWVEHAAWVVFEDVFLVLSCLRGQSEMRKIADNTARLDASEARYRSVTDSASEAIITIDQAGLIIFANRSAERIFGYRIEELTGRNALDFLPREDHRRTTRLLRAFISGRLGASAVSEVRVLRKDGSEFISETSFTCNEFDERPTITAIIRDVTERKLAEDALRRTEEYRNLFRHANDAILIIEPVTEMVIDVNDRACEEYGLTRDELIGRSLKEMTENISRGEKYLAEMLRTRETRSYESVHYRANGERVLFMISASEIEYEGRTAILVIARDITERQRVKDELERNFSLLNSTFDATADGILAVGLDNEVIAANSTFLDMWAVPHENGKPLMSSNEISKQVGSLLKDPSELLSLMQRSKDDPNEVHMATLELGDGRIIERFTQPQLCDGRTIGRVLSFRDITNQKRTELTLRENEARLKTLLDNMSEGLLQVDRDDNIVYMNDSICEMTGYSQAELIGTKWTRLLIDEDEEFLKTVNDRRRKGQSDRYEIRIRKNNEEIIWVVVGGAPVTDSSGEVIGSMGVFSDITERKRAEEQLLHDAFHDGLTGLANRTLFMEHLRLAIERKDRHEKPFAVLYLDFDRFKVVNDSLGHAEGDKLLQYIARRMENCTRSGDLLARLGGDEFVILLNELDGVDEAAAIAERIQADLKTAFDVGGREIFTSTSIGITLSTSGHTNADDMLRDADIAMYFAKSKGKAQYAIFDQAMHKHASRRLQIETEMRLGIDRGEFKVFYQPIMDLSCATLMGFEALLRWQHPERGLIQPDEFIPVAEENGMIMRLGQMVVEESCRQLRSWQRTIAGAEDLTVSVNLSSKEFLQLDLVDNISATLRRTRLRASSLKLEITESHIMENSELAVAIMKRLGGLGIDICLDDFGTGYSSLSYLHKLPVSYLKIDRSFVGRMLQNEENREIVNTILRLAQNLKMKVIAEGIETEDQLAELRGLSCEYGQGYLFAKPLAAADTKKFITNDVTRMPILDESESIALVM
jgi:diguanylate cyclase (GGDEF)-like protein/PAS domain S-box-containing protein